jgi:undecaprenyl pyrophosphate synthase
LRPIHWHGNAAASNPTDEVLTGVLKGYLAQTHRAVSQKLAAYYGTSVPGLTLTAPHHLPTSSPARMAGSENGQLTPSPKNLTVMLISAEDGRDSIVDLTKTLTEMAQRNKISASQVSIDLLDAELSENVMTDPDLLILFGPYVELAGYPPWHIRLTEIFHVQDNQSVGYQVFLRGVRKYAQAQMRFGT